jgi:hypothetical protein
MPILGWAIVALFAGVLIALIFKRNRELAREAQMKKARREVTV